MHFTPFTPGFGAVLRGGPGQTFDDVPLSALQQELQSSGFVLLRGFEAADASVFEAFCDRFELPTLHHGGTHAALEGFDSATRRVTNGHDAVGFHSEASGLPVRPDVVFFYCREPSQADGQTVVCDGFQVWDALSDSLKATFQDRWLEYTTPGIPKDVWQRALGVDTIERALQAIEKFCELLDARFERVELAPGPGEALVGRYALSAVVPLIRDGRERLAFSNALFGPYDRYPTFDGGDPIDREMLTELMQVELQLANLVQWKAGDLLIVDNWRVMHGRLPFEGPRDIIVRMVGRRCGFGLFSG